MSITFVPLHTRIVEEAKSTLTNFYIDTALVLDEYCGQQYKCTCQQCRRNDSCFINSFFMFQRLGCLQPQHIIKYYLFDNTIFWCLF